MPYAASIGHQPGLSPRPFRRCITPPLPVARLSLGYGWVVGGYCLALNWLVAVHFVWSVRISGLDRALI
jgi:hypothetical protein